ncbi:hypothetical protein WR25_20301 [Diploscapter pachys]|uniref:HIT-type domain-containing protein n=1 Tax=Diploscapter pachys TaxID=2018661 RepID=A0A2A2LP90_9BILA|nr:hypothetical protein WR25_20301 [Diploscapter pachys]
MTDAPCSSKTLTSSLAPEALTKFRRCAFCSIEQKELYKCPRCQQEYCSLRCYKSQKHSACSESFYKDCVKEELQGRQYEGEKGAETFEEHMQKFLRGETEKIPGVQNPDPENEEEGELVDSDDEPEEDYLKRVVEGTIERYSENDDDIERQLIAMGLGSDVQQLLDSLTVEERAAFAQLAEEVHINSTGLNQSAFKPK